MRKRLLSLISLLTLAAGCNGPLPFLAGENSEVRSSSHRLAGAHWTDRASVIQLETNPAEPYSINIAYTVVADQLYVYAGDTKTEWVKNMEEDPKVRFRREGLIYELLAERVTDGGEREAFAKAWAARGLFSRDPQKLDEVWLYRLLPRQRTHGIATDCRHALGWSPHPADSRVLSRAFFLALHAVAAAIGSITAMNVFQCGPKVAMEMKRSRSRNARM